MTEVSVFDFNFEAGVDAGLERAEAFGLPSDLGLIEEPLHQARAVIESWPHNDLGGKFQAMYAENVTVASLARVRSHEQPLRAVELRATLGFLEWIFDSLVSDE